MAGLIPVTVRVAALALVLPLAACASSGGGKGTSLASLGGGSSARQQPNLLTPLGNGLLGSSINQLSASDRIKALEAEYRALEYAQSGKTISWQGSGSAEGEVTAAQPYQVGSQNCRQYSHSFTIKDAPQTVRGTACRNADGSWSPLI